MKLILTILLLVLIKAPCAVAQDVATEHTQILNNVELVINAERQLQSLLNEAQMIENQVEQLKSVAVYQNTWVNVDSQRSTLFNLVSQGVSISNQIQAQLTQMQQQAEALANTGSLSDQQAVVGQGVLNIIQTTLDRVNQSRQTYQSQENGLEDLLQKNNQAIGQTQALQVLNQISAQNVSQMQATQELLNNVAVLEATKMLQEYQDKKSQTDRVNQIVHPADTGTSSFDFGK